MGGNRESHITTSKTGLLTFPVYQAEWGMKYIRISEIPEAEREPFKKHLAGQTCPLIEHNDEAYLCDYLAWKKGKPVWD